MERQPIWRLSLAQFVPLLTMLSDVPDPRRVQGKKYKQPHVLLFFILAVATGCNSYRGIVTFIDVHRSKLNAALGRGRSSECERLQADVRIL